MKFINFDTVLKCDKIMLLIKINLHLSIVQIF